MTLFLETDYQSYWDWLSFSQITELREELKIKLTINSMVDLLNRIGFTYKQTICVPCEVDTKKQHTFIEELNHLLKETTDNESVIYFIDAVSASNSPIL